MKYVINTFAIILILVLTSSAVLYAENTNLTLDLQIIPQEEINEQFSGSVVRATDHRTGNTQVNEFYKDGTVISKSKGKERKGLWYTDDHGQHCIRWDKKDKSNCALIMRDDEGNWVKVKDDVVIKSYESFDELNSISSKK